MSNATQTANGLHGFYPEMGDAKPDCQIKASLSHYGRHWYLRTKLTLKGRGVRFLDVNEAAGDNRYQVTERAFETIKANHSISLEILL